MRNFWAVATGMTLCTAAIVPASAATTPVEPDWAASNPAYTTYHYDGGRSGWNPHEQKLTVAAVASKRFGRIRTLPTDGVVYAQPLYVPHVRTRYGTRDIVYLATEGDGVYAYDANTGEALWRRTFVNPAAGVTAVSQDSVAGCNAISPTIGISSTPVIDRARKLIYVVDKIQTTTGTTTTYENDIHALDLDTGGDHVSPERIQGTYVLADGSSIPFNDQKQQNRVGLAISHGNVYVSFGSSCDAVPGAVHGWVFSYDATTLHPIANFNTTASGPDTYLGAIWQSTVAPAVDPAGDLYFAVGNGTFAPFTGRGSYGDSVLRMTPALTVRDFFSPSNNLLLTQTDQDVSSNGVMLVPDSEGTSVPLAVSGAKNGVVYLLDRDNLGRFDARADRIVQELTIEKMPDSLYGLPAYYPGYIFWGAGMQPMQAFAITHGAKPQLVAKSHTSNVFAGEGGEIPIVSSNGTQPGSAVVWATTRPMQGANVELFAYDARDLGRTLFHGVVGPWLSTGDAFLTPTAVGGHVFVPGAGTGVAEFGLR